MFIGHLAAGYIATSAWLDWRPQGLQHQRTLMAAGLVCSVLPDSDMLRFYLLDQQRYHHHSYVTHMPLFWMALLGGIVLAGWRLRSGLVLRLGMVAGANILLHLVLDSLVGSIQWLAPFSRQGFTLVEVARRYEPWYLNFMLHWTFLLELALIALAAVLYARRKKRPPAV